MKRIISLYCLSILSLLLGCEKKEVRPSDIFKKLTLSDTTAVGDGAQTVNIVCEINPETTEENLEFVLKTSMGMFVDNKEKKIVKKPEFVGGKLVIETTAQVPLSSGTMTISVEPNKPLEKRDFIIQQSLTVTKSVPSSISLTSTALGLGSNFLTEVQLTGTLSNQDGGKVATGYKVVFSDTVAGTKVPANGRYRGMASSSNDESKVTTYYGAGSLPIGTDIRIKAAVLDEKGVPTPLADSLTLRINL
jgi:hypothetical protein